MTQAAAEAIGSLVFTAVFWTALTALVFYYLEPVGGDDDD